MQNVPFRKTDTNICKRELPTALQPKAKSRAPGRHLLERKKACINCRQSSSRTPAVTVALG